MKNLFKFTNKYHYNFTWIKILNLFNPINRCINKEHKNLFTIH